jgi:hypothetical protein
VGGTSDSMGYTYGLFQYMSNSDDSLGTTAPATSVSMSMKFEPPSRRKYSLAMLRPPITPMVLSTT